MAHPVALQVHPNRVELLVGRVEVEPEAEAEEIARPPDTFHPRELPLPEPGPGEVRVRVRASGVGSTDITMRRGSYRFAPKIPFAPGYEVVGDVEALGAGRVFATDVSPYRLDWARRSGAAEAFDGIAAGERLPDMLRAANDGNLADLVILGTGAPSAIDQGLACLENGATFVVFAVPAPGQDHPMPLNDLWRREVTVRTAYGAAPADLAMALDLIANGRVRVADLVTHRLPLDRAAEGFQLVAGAGESVKVIIEPWERDPE